MSQANRLMDLLDGEDDDGETSAEEAQELEALLRARTPTPQAQPAVGGNVAPQIGGSFNNQPQQRTQAQPGSQMRPGTPQQNPQAGGSQQTGPQPGTQQRPSSMGKFPFHLLQSWCGKNLPQDQGNKLAALQAVKIRHENTSMTHAKEIYTDIGRAIGPEKLQEFSKYFAKQLETRGLVMQGKSQKQPGQAGQHQAGMQAQVAQQRTQEQHSQAVQQQARSLQNQGNTGQTGAQNGDQGRLSPLPGQPNAPSGQNPGQTAQRQDVNQASIQARPAQPWMGNGLPYAKPSAMPQGGQGARGTTFPAFTPTPPGQSTQQQIIPSAGTSALSQGRSHSTSSQPISLTPAQRTHTIQQAPSSARPPLAPSQNFQTLTPSTALKNPADSAPAGQPQAKRLKKEKEDIDEENDIFKDTGVNLEEEQNALLGNIERAPAAAKPQQQQIAEVPFLNLNPLQVKIEEIARRHGLTSVDPKIGQLLSRALDAHFTSIMGQTFSMARQRTDADRRRPGMVLSNNLRKKLHEINMKEEEARKQKEAEKLQEAETGTQAGSKRKREEDAQSKKGEKAARKETEKQQASAANAAAVAAFGKTKWNKWGQAPKTASKPTSENPPKSPKPGSSKPATPTVSGELKKEEKKADIEVTRATSKTADGLGASRVNAENLTAKLPDLIAVMEKDRMYQKSTLLYRLLSQNRD